MTPDEGITGMDQLMQAAAQMGASIQEQMLPARYLYKMCLWEEVNPAAAEGWEVHPSGPWPVQCEWPDPSNPTIMRSGMKPCFLMFRKRTVADDAAALTAQGMPAELAEGLADGSIPVIELPNEVGQGPSADA